MLAEKYHMDHVLGVQENIMKMHSNWQHVFWQLSIPSWSCYIWSYIHPLDPIAYKYVCTMYIHMLWVICIFFDYTIVSSKLDHADLNSLIWSFVMQLLMVECTHFFSFYGCFGIILLTRNNIFWPEVNHIWAYLRINRIWTQICPVRVQTTNYYTKGDFCVLLRILIKSILQ